MIVEVLLNILVLYDSFHAKKLRTQPLCCSTSHDNSGPGVNSPPLCLLQAPTVNLLQRNNLADHQSGDSRRFSWFPAGLLDRGPDFIPHARGRRPGPSSCLAHQPLKCHSRQIADVWQSSGGFDLNFSVWKLSCFKTSKRHFTLTGGRDDTTLAM